MNVYRRIVAKFGSNVLTAGSDCLDLGFMSRLVEQVAALQQQGAEVIIVSSGAMAAGRHKLGMQRIQRRDIPFRQVTAAVGQSCIMYTWDQLFGEHGITVAQTLLTKMDLADRQGYLNARNTLLALMELGVIAIVNENDVVAVDEIKEAKFGDNDNLSAMVANLVDADLLVLLTDTSGLFTADPNRDPKAQLIKRVEHIDEKIEQLAAKGVGDRGTGGMATKVRAAKLATASGVTVAIANGQEPDVLLRLAQGEHIGTLFPPTTSKLESRKRWLVSGLARKGKLLVDDGAVAALLQGNCSLLPAGISGIEGRFQRGDIVDIVDRQGRRIACGISNYSSRDIEGIKGCRSDKIEECLGYEYGDEVVHRNNLVVV